MYLQWVVKKKQQQKNILSCVHKIKEMEASCKLLKMTLTDPLPLLLF